MPLYIDVHELKGVKAEDVAKAHEADMAVQGRHGVEFRKYWVNEGAGKVFCLVHAPSAEAANLVHKEAHGLEAARMLEVQPELADAFMGGGQVNPAGAAVAPPGGGAGLDPGIRTILFTDIVGSTSLTQQLGDEAAMKFVHLHDDIVMDALEAQSGRKVKHTGDGIMAAFASAACAVRCAIRVQEAISRLHPGNGHGLKVRIGAAAGEPVEHKGDFFGSTVQLAARLCAHAQPQQTLVSNGVVELCIGKGLRFEDVGALSLKGFEQAVRAHAVAN